MSTEVYLRLEVQHVDGPRRESADVAAAAVFAIAGESLELLTHEAFPVRSRYLVDDAEVIRADQMPPEVRA
jgi:hypothetical protein